MSPDTSLALITHTPEQTREIGIDIGRLAQAGDLILLVGDLGTGKTCLAQGIGRGVGFEGSVSSPSFVLIREYPARLTLYHIDLYRLDDIEEIAELGLDDYLLQEGLCVIEWADKAPDFLPNDRLVIRLEHLEENQRRLEFQAYGTRYDKLLEQLKKKWNLP